MNIKRNFNHFQILLNQGVDLLLLRLRMLHLDLSDQAGCVMRIFAAIVLMGALFALSIVSLLLGLNHVLSDEAKIWVFFGISGACLLTIVIMAIWAVGSWKNKNSQTAATLREIQEDIAYLSGAVKKHKVGGKDGNTI